MLYLLESTTNKVEYDVRKAFLIRAGSEDEARVLANENCMDEGKIWQNRRKVKCTIVKEDGPTEIIIIDTYAM